MTSQHGTMELSVEERGLEFESLRAELAALRRENVRLEQQQKKEIRYIREKVDQLLQTIGTCPLKSEELDDEHLIALDPIGIVSETFSQILDHLRYTNHQLGQARDEIAAIFHAAAAGILVLDPSRQILSYNRKLQEFFLIAGQDALGCQCSEAICGRQEKMSECVFEKVIASGHGEHRSDILFGDRHYDVVGMPITGSDGILSQIVLVYNDITEQKASEAALRTALAEARDARGKLDAILHSVSDPLIVVDAHHRVVLVNRAAEDLLGICLHQPLGRALRKAMAEPLLAGTALLSGAADRLEFALLDQGRERFFQARTSSLREGNEGVAGTVILLHEVTREREVERMKSEFVSTAAHELQTPLTAIIGFAELLLSDDPLPAEVRRESLQFVHQKAERLSLLVDDLLDVGSLEAGRELELTLDVADINLLLRRVIRSFDLHSSRHQFELNLPEEPLYVRIDHRRIAKVLENIIGNAIKYSPAGGLIQISGGLEGGNYEVAITDQGIGMSAEQRERVFERFYRGDASDTSLGGTGLGMSIARHNIEAHGGRIWVESRQGEGSRVHFQLPLG
ncbi:MAG: PAS domain-containing protein [Desulfuromonadales bacterium]|nr:PAS domain-containing protein [Desulfuromonadales bacterium]